MSDLFNKNSDSVSDAELHSWWRTVFLLSLSASERLAYNLRRYEKSDSQRASQIKIGEEADTDLQKELLNSGNNAVLPDSGSQLLQQLDEIGNLLLSYQNLQIALELDESGDNKLVNGLFLCLHRIHNGLHIFHHELTELPSDVILPLIAPLDQLIRMWDIDPGENAADLTPGKATGAIDSDVSASFTSYYPLPKAGQTRLSIQLIAGIRSSLETLSHRG
ncbi:MAG: hypothetical protein LAT67_03875 [Balneolales bacterium]|nr:hypothetical protein [Balneolales bacterium]